MKHIEIGGYCRITKTAARKAFENGETIRLVPSNCSPVNAWGIGSNVNRGNSKTSFDAIINAYGYYNCQHNALGKRVAFYTVPTVSAASTGSAHWYFIRTNGYDMIVADDGANRYAYLGDTYENIFAGYGDREPQTLINALNTLKRVAADYDFTSAGWQTMTETVDELADGCEILAEYFGD